MDRPRGYREIARARYREGCRAAVGSDGAVAGHEEDLAAAGAPFFADPAAADRPADGFGVPCLDGQDIAGRACQAAFEDAGDAVAFLGVLELGIGRIDIFRQRAFLDDPLRRVFVGGHDHICADAEFGRECGEECLRLLFADTVITAFAGDEIGVLPDRAAILAPVEGKGPARQAFARIPLALTVMEETAGSEFLAQLADEDIGLVALGGADGAGIPFVGFEIVDRHEGRLAAHGQANVLRGQNAVHLFAEIVERLPAFLGKRLGDARVFCNARHRHLEAEGGLGLAEIAAGNRCRIAEMRRGGERNMAFAGQKAGGRIKADPAGAGQIDLAPGMKVGEIHLGAGGAVERLQVRGELDEIAGDEAGGKAEMAQDLHKQPGRVTTRAFFETRVSCGVCTPGSMRMT